MGLFEGLPLPSAISLILIGWYGTIPVADTASQSPSMQMAAPQQSQTPGERSSRPGPSKKRPEGFSGFHSPTSHLKMAPMGAFCIFGIQLDMLCRWQLLSHHRQLEEYAQDCAQERPQDLHQRQRSQRCRHLYCWRHWKGAHPDLRLRNP